MPSSILPVVVIVHRVGELVFVTILFHSIETTPALTLVRVVSVACHSSIDQIVCTSLVLFIGRFVPFACTLPVPFGTRFILILDELPVAVSVIVPVPPANWW